MKNYKKEFEKAKERLKIGKKSVDANRKQQRLVKEPEILRSGQLDEVELIRRQKGLDDE